MSQNISVSSFRFLDSDLTANTTGSIEKDQNGETSALIKVVTTQTGFTFDGGALGIVKTIQKPSEIWVYVPRGLKKITISHPQLGLLRDYYFSCPIEAGRTYEMVLISGSVETTIRQSRTSQYVVFQMTPSNAVVELNGEQLQATDGTATKMLKFGTYNYRVNAPNYLPEAGNITINDSENKHIVNVSLKPNYSVVTLKVDTDAEIWVNGEQKGVCSWTGNLGAGTYEFETRKQNYRSIANTYDIVVTSEPQVIQLQAPVPIYGEADINSTPAMADVYIDGKSVGQTPLMISNLLIGEHQIRIIKNGYNVYSDILRIKENEKCLFMAKLNKITEKLTFMVDSVEFNMIRVEGGTFIIGDKDTGKKEISVSSFYIGETEVTQELWNALMGNNPSDYLNIGNQHPVDNVDWDDCQMFIRKLNKKSKMKFRLPTETEWEFAARGGNSSHNYIYSGSNNLDEIAWYEENSSTKTHNVKTKKLNELGLYDMSGNVWEWCNDWYREYNNLNNKTPKGPVSRPKMVYRGGSYNLPATYLKSTRRNSNTPNYKVRTIGFRLAMSDN